MQHEQLYHSLLDDDGFFQWLLHPTNELNEYWNQIMQENPEKEKAANELKTIIKGMKVVEEELSAEDKTELWRQIESSVQRKRKTFRVRTLLRYAAVCALLLALSVYFLMRRGDIPAPQIDYQAFISDTTAAGNHSANVVIVMDNNEKIELNEQNVEVIHDAEGKLSVNSEVIEKKESKDAPGNHLNQIYVPYGKTTNMVLSDGSKIWINSGSRMLYPSVFEANKREIYVEGEAYMEVTKNEKSPFIVKTDMMEIEVLGTSFNVSAYKNDGKQSVVLATGSVTVKGNTEKDAKTIRPNQKYTFEKHTNTSGIQDVDVFDYICWKYGFLSFKNEKLSVVLNRVERYYNVRIDYDASATDRTSVSGKLDLKDTIEETFRIISITAPIEYHIRDGEIRIDVKP
jgi:ferric-dicitrate binding protein FerR (iron transport regulator)